MTSAASQDRGLLGAIDHQARAHPRVLDALFALVIAALHLSLSLSKCTSYYFSCFVRRKKFREAKREK